MISWLINNEHGIKLAGGLAILLCLNILLAVGKFLFKLFEKKSDKAEESLRGFQEKAEAAVKKMAHIEGRMEQLFL
jgi:hypothetical protein